MFNKHSAIRACFYTMFATTFLSCIGCIKPNIALITGATEPLKEYTLQGSGKNKVLVIPVNGFISDRDKAGLLYHKASTLKEIVSQLRLAEEDKKVKAVILKIDSPGGSVTASDILYHEIERFKEHSGSKLVVMIMGLATSGGYYIALPADSIMAHPTSITGSIGVIFLRPNVSGMMDKLGLKIEVDKSGKNKDMGSPFRGTTGEEQQVFKVIIDDLARRFTSLVITHRRLNKEAEDAISSARVYSASEALRLGLVDQIGYMDDAIRKAIEIAALPKDARVVVYHRTEHPNDNLYNASGSKIGPLEVNLISLGLEDVMPPLRGGLYYLWLPGLSN